MYVLQRSEDGKYVAPSGSPMMYVSDLAKACNYPSREAAERDRCVQNERIVAVADIMPRYR